MLLTITTTRPPATALGFLLHKHPDRAQSFASNDELLEHPAHAFDAYRKRKA